MSHLKTVAAVPALALFATAGLLVAGPLNPASGPVASTYKTLGDVEPRTAVNATNTPGNATSVFRISQPGSYYLTGNIAGQVGKHGILIDAPGVTLDLNGMRVVGVNNALTAIKSSPNGSDITVRNGSVMGWPTGGIDLSGSEGPMLVETMRVSQISAGPGIRSRGPATIRNCSVLFSQGFGIQLTEFGTVTECSVSNAGNDGFEGGSGVQFTNCAANGCQGEGFSVTGTIRGCTANNNTGVGILAGFGSTVTDCTVSGNTMEGIRALGNAVISRCQSDGNSQGIRGLNGVSIDGCTAADNATDGIELGSACSATNNLCRRNGTTGIGAGILAVGVTNRIDSNSVFDNDFGVRTVLADTIVTRNSARANASGNFSFLVPIESAQILINPGGNFVATNPWANFAF